MASTKARARRNTTTLEVANLRQQLSAAESTAVDLANQVIELNKKVADLTSRLTEARRRTLPMGEPNATNNLRFAGREKLQTIDQSIDRYNAEIDRLRKAMENLQQVVSDAHASKAAILVPDEVDTTSLKAQIASVEGQNAKYRVLASHQAISAEIASKCEELGALEATLGKKRSHQTGYSGDRQVPGRGADLWRWRGPV